MHTSRIILSLALLTPLALTAPACSGDDSSPNSTDDGGAGDDGATGSDSGSDGQADAGQDSGSVTCNALAPSTTPVTVFVMPGTAPTAMGGALADGTYVVQEATVYGPVSDAGDGGVPAGTTDLVIKVEGNTINIAQTSKGELKTETDTVTISGNTLNFTPTCPSGKSSGSAQFSVLPADADAGVPKGGFLLISSEGGATGVVKLVAQ